MPAGRGPAEEGATSVLKYRLITGPILIAALRPQMLELAGRGTRRRRQLAAGSRELRPHLPRARWVRSELMHLTLLFLGFAATRAANLRKPWC